MDLPTNCQALSATIKESLALAVRALGGEGELELTPPPRSELGDLCVACFPLTRSLRKPPQAIAVALAAELRGPAIASASAEGPYVNLRLDTRAFASAAIGEFLHPTPRPEKAHVLVEFSSPNTNKPQHLGHIRNNLLGDASSRILVETGHKVTRVNLINDRGIHICKSMVAYKRFGGGETPESSGKKGDHLVGDYYVRFETAFRAEYEAWLASESGQRRFETWLTEPDGRKSAERRKKAAEKAGREKDEDKRAAQLAKLPELWDTFRSEYKDGYFNGESALGTEARDMLVAWEDGEPATRKLWETMNGWVFQGFDETYRRMRISFDHIDKESETYVLGKSLVEEGLAAGAFELLENGAIGCRLEKVGLEGTKVLLRGDGTSVYMTQDLGTAFSRFDRFGAERMIYVVADEQDHHFDVLFRILGLLRPELRGACHHLSYGMVNLPSGKMKSREGTVVDADDLLDELESLARDATREKWPELPEADVPARARAIGLSALKYYILNFNPKTTVLFDPKSSIEFTGNTGPYNLYAYARANNIFATGGLTFDRAPLEPEVLDRLVSDGERAVLQSLVLFPPEVERSARELDPSKVTAATYAVSRAFAAFYIDHPVLQCPDEGLKKARLQLCRAVAAAVRLGLGLLGIEVIERM